MLSARQAKMVLMLRDLRALMEQTNKRTILTRHLREVYGLSAKSARAWLQRHRSELGLRPLAAMPNEQDLQVAKLHDHGVRVRSIANILNISYDQAAISLNRALRFKETARNKKEQNGTKKNTTP